MLWFLRGLRRGVVTTRYPAKVDEWTVTLPSVPAFRSGLLTDELAARLQAACPTGALRHDPGALVVDLGACTGCGRCIDANGGVVQSSGEFLLSAWRREDLIKRIPINGTTGRTAAGPVGGRR
jgi:hypothetical protein